MPLYEFYCEPCHTIYTFRFLKVDTKARPPCPVCGAPLSREVSTFAHIIRGGGQLDEKTTPPYGDPSAGGEFSEEILAKMGDRIQALDDDDADPREAVKVMREMAEAGGLHFDKDVREAMARIEAGEDPEKIDEQFSEVFDRENPFAAPPPNSPPVKGCQTKENSPPAKGCPKGGVVSLRALRYLRPPRRDPTWHEVN